MAEPSFERDGREAGGVSGRTCDQGRHGWCPPDITDQHNNNNKVQQTEEEPEDEEVTEKDGSKQVHD